MRRGWWKFSVLCLVVFGMLPFGPWVFAQGQRDITVMPKVVAGSVPITGQYWALIIGIDEYQHAPNLESAVKDATAVRDVLKSRYGFQQEQIITLLNEQATGASIQNALYRLGRQASSNDSVFIYYAGHGQYDEEGRLGWWVPTEADPSNPGTFLMDVAILSYIKGMKAKHVYLVADSCFSGTLFGTRSLPPIDDRWFGILYAKQSRWGLTSGSKEPVADYGKNGHSVFAYHFLALLRENTAPYLVPSRIYDRLAPLISNNSEQTPRSEPLKGTGDEGGQFVFRLVQGELETKPVVATLPPVIAKAPAFQLPQEPEQPGDRCARLEKEGRFGQAVQVCQELADQGNPKAQMTLSNLYWKGVGGLTKSLPVSVSWMRKAADQGYVSAQEGMANLYIMGRGVPKDYKQAALWYQKAADQGNMNAQAILGGFYSKGLAGEVDFRKAEVLLTKAAEQGHTLAQKLLGDLYLQGKGVPQSLPDAFHWYGKAAEHGNSGAMYVVAFLYSKGLGVSLEPKLAAEWFHRAGLAFLAEGNQKDAKNCIDGINKLGASYAHLADELQHKL